MKRISQNIDSIKPSYDVVVIGSGYGAGITASRLSRAGKNVCVLERGREILPGEYPDTNNEAVRELQLHTPDGHVGNKTGLFDIHVNKEQNVVVGCGLGGTSLINANVSLQPEPEVFEDPRWPDEIRAHQDTLLKEGFEHAHEMLKPNPYPDNYPKLNKLEAHKKSAAAMDQDFYLPPINVTFETPPNGINHVGVEQSACTNCGDCISGCNYGAKNTILMNYLPDAWNHGADIFCEVSVKYIQKTAQGWLVNYQPVDEERKIFNAPTLFVKADLIMIAAGTLGSTEILLRSKEKGLQLSDKLGKHFSGNGDILGFGYNCNDTINGIGFGEIPPDEIKSRGMQEVGPCITSIIDMREGDDWRKRMIIEEGSLPGAIGKLIPMAMATAAGVFGKDTDHGFSDKIDEISNVTSSLLRGPYFGATKKLQTYLVMSHDNGAGKMNLVDDALQLDWPNIGEQINFKIGNKNLLDATKPLGGTYVKNPIWSKAFKNSLVTVHPLGGCVMGRDSQQGVTNHKGQVFSSIEGTEVHDGLYVSDGSIIPTSLAVNPLYTISALTERCCALIAKDKGWIIDYTLPSSSNRTVAENKLGLRFTETMKGYFSTKFQPGENKNSFENALKFAKTENRVNSTMKFTLSVSSNDLNQLLDIPEHNANISGTLEAPALSDKPMLVSNGVFNLFEIIPDRPETRHMKYKMQLTSTEGKQFWFSAYKEIRDDPDILEIWPDTSTLYVTVYEGTNDQGAMVGKGILHIKPEDFAKQMTTLDVTNAKNLEEKLTAVTRFGKFFAGTLWQTYGGVLYNQPRFNPDAPPRKKRALRAPAPAVFNFRTEDDVTLRLTRYQGGDKGPVMLVHGLGVASSIFSTDTIDTNLVEYLVAHQYDVWLLDFRVSIDLPAGLQESTGDQVAQYDFPAAVKVIKEQTQCNTIQAIVHCYGATTFFMSMLAGLKDIRSIVCSQIATDAVIPTTTKIKTGLHFPGFLDTIGVDSLNAYVDDKQNWVSKLYDKALGVYALSEAQGNCNNPVCHRITFMYASLYRHDKLNNLLHANLHELFSEANIKSLMHLAEICRQSVVVSSTGEDIYMPHIKNLDLPICFISGANNECYLPESTERTYKRLQQQFGEQQYTRKLILGYGHIDCIFGAEAVVDVYPHILEHLEKTAKKVSLFEKVI